MVKRKSAGHLRWRTSDDHTWSHVDLFLAFKLNKIVLDVVSHHPGSKSLEMMKVFILFSRTSIY
jgi:hypothetical protein